MNQERMTGIRKQLGGLLTEQWGRLTGRRQSQRAVAARESDRQIEDFMHRNRYWRDLSRH